MACSDTVKLESCSIVIFGASGDLTARKLMPALFRMYRKGFLPEPVVILGCARTPFSDEQFRGHIGEKCCKDKNMKGAWLEFAQFIHYQQIDYSQLSSYKQLRLRLTELQEMGNASGSIIFDLAVPPGLYGTIATHLGEAGLAKPQRDDEWVRLVVEKPFGRDLRSALELENELHRYFEEEQIYRIDHYLAKETVQNILSFRFANQIFEPLWNRNHIEWVGIISSEKLGVENRAGYYDSSGVLRDMFQNHMMQLLSLVAMEPPSRFQADAIRDEKNKIFRSILPFSGHDEDIVLGQYTGGTVEGSELKGYLDEHNVASGSRTPTFALLKLDIDNWRWQGVPFYLISGKRMNRKETRVVIQFKEAPLLLFKGVVGEHVSHNRLVLSVYPEESIQLSFQAKIPGPRLCLRTGNLEFCYNEGGEEAVLEAYEKVLLDCIMGDHMLFWRRDGIAATWKILTPILEDCEGDECRFQQLHPYASGSWGPEAAREMVENIVR